MRYLRCQFKDITAAEFKRMNMSGGTVSATRREVESIFLEESGRTAEFMITQNFKESCCRMLGVSEKGSTSKHYTFVDLFQSAATKLGDEEVILYVNEDKAVSLFRNDINYIPHQVGEELLDRIEHLDPQDMIIDEIGVDFTVLKNNTFDAFEGDGGKYRNGIRVSIPFDGRPTGQVNLVTNRELSGASVIIRSGDVSSKYDLRVLDEDTILNELCDGIKFMLVSMREPENWVADRLEKLKDTNASLQELLECGGMIRKHSNRIDATLIEPLMIDKIMDAYGMVSINDQTYQWRKTAKTPVKKIDLFNLLAEAAASVDMGNRLILQEYAGDMLNKKGDLESVAPNIDFKEVDRTNMVLYDNEHNRSTRSNETD